MEVFRRLGRYVEPSPEGGGPPMATEIVYIKNRRDRSGWSELPFETAVRPHSRPTPEVTCRAAYDADGLHLELQVPRPWGVSGGERSWRHGDGLQVTVSPEAIDGRVSRFVTLGFGLVGGEPKALLVNRNGRWLLRPAPGRVGFVVRPEPSGGALYIITLPWSSVVPVHGLIDAAAGLNITYVGRVPSSGVLSPGAPAVAQLVSDPSYDEETEMTRRVTPVLFVETESRTVLSSARLDRAFASDDQPAFLELGLMAARRGRVEVLAEAHRRQVAVSGEPAASEPAVGEPAASEPAVGEPAAPSARRISRSIASYELYPGRNVFRHDWRSGILKTGDYLLAVDLTVNGRPDLHLELPFYRLRREDVADLRGRYDRVVNRLSGRLHQSLPSVAIRFQWLENLRTGLDPADDPIRLRETYLETSRMITALEAGTDPFTGQVGYQRRAFRSRLDGSLQPYSVHVPSAAASVHVPSGAAGPSSPRFPLLVLLHGSCGSTADEIAVATQPALVRELDARGWLLCAPLGRDPSGRHPRDVGRDLLEALEAVRAALPVDERAVFLAGASRGGFGVWRHGPSNRDRFAGLVVISGPTRPPTPSPLEPGPAPADPDDPEHFLERASGLPVFVAHGELDEAVPIGPTRDLVLKAKQAGARVVFREYPEAGHADYNPWSEVFEWMERVRMDADA